VRKAERLFQLITLLRNRRLAITAASLAELLEVSERTIYRDIQALMVSGVPIEGEAGVGYRLNSGFHLPPLMFTSDELLSLLVGSRMVQAWSDPELAKAASLAMSKITSILPEQLTHNTHEETIIVPDFMLKKKHAIFSQQLRNAIESKTCICVDYRRADEEFSHRVIEPLGLVFWGNKWTLIAFCQLRGTYREFRLDRIITLNVLEESFNIDPSKNLQHYLSLSNCK